MTQNPTIYVRVRTHLERRSGTPPLVKVYSLQAHSGDKAWVDQIVSEDAEHILEVWEGMKESNGPARVISIKEDGHG